MILRLLLILCLFCTPVWAGADLDGTDDEGNLSSLSTIDNLTTYTIYALVELDDYTDYDTIAAKADPGVWACWNGWYFAIGACDGTRRVALFHGTDGTAIDVKSQDNSIPASGKFSVIARVDGSKIGTLYVDGVEVGGYFQQDQGTGSFTADAAYDMYLGRQSCAENISRFNGRIYEYAVWDDDLAVDLIAIIGKSHTRHVPVNIYAPIVYLTLDEISAGTSLNGLTLLDYSGNGNNCTFTGGTSVAESVISGP